MEGDRAWPHLPHIHSDALFLADSELVCVIVSAELPAADFEVSVCFASLEAECEGTAATQEHGVISAGVRHEPKLRAFLVNCLDLFCCTSRSFYHLLKFLPVLSSYWLSLEMLRYVM